MKNLMPGAPPTEFVRADSFTLDERINRRVNQTRVRKIALALRVDAIGVVTANRRDDGTLVLLDGQHRIMALLESGHADTLVAVYVHSGKSLAEEAAIMLTLNATQRVNPIETYRIGLTACDEECLAIQKIVDAAGLRVEMHRGPGTISCVTTMRRLFRKGGPNALAPALAIPVAAWGTDASSTEGVLIDGIGEVFCRYANEIDRGALIKKLAKYPGGASGLIGKAKGLHDFRTKVSVGRCVASIVVEVYNNRRSDQLPPL